MDFSKFADENFEVKEWINSALKAHKDAGVPVDTHASNLVMKLQLFIQEVNKSLEETSQIAINNLPRVLREVESIKGEAMLLKEQMQMVKDDIRTVEENTAQSMKMLVEIDEIKERMQAASNALQEADNWTTLSADVEEVFSTRDVDKIAEKLTGMQKSLAVLQDVPDYAERRRLLESLKNRLEALLSTKLVVAFNNHSLEEAKRYVQIFNEIGRLEQLQTYYNNCHKGNLLKSWNEVREDPTKTITVWLPTFFDNLLSLWHKEISWCGQVFPDPIVVLSSLLSQTLSHLDPSISECINEAIKEEKLPLKILIQLRQVTNRLLGGLVSAIKSGPGESSSSTSIGQLVTTIQTPYVAYLLQYSELQQAELMEGIEDMQLYLKDFAETAAGMAESAGQAFRLAEEANDSCWKFTEGYGVLGFLDALRNFFAAYLGKLDSLIIELRRVCSLDTNNRLENRKADLDDEDQWTNFQNAFRLIDMCGHLLLKVSEFREQVGGELRKKLPEICGKSNRSTASLASFNYLKSSRPMEFDHLLEFEERIQTYGINVFLPSVQEQVERLNEHAHKFAFDIVFIHLRRHLSDMPNLEIWSSKSASTEAITDDLPTFSLSPQGYITQVGDYLLTLPQQLEPLFTHENFALTTALKAGLIPYCNSQETDVEHYDHYWVIGFAHGTMQVLLENILKIQELTPHSTRQLVADIDYFCNILEALEVNPSDELRTIKELLQVDADSFHELAAQISADSYIENTLAKIRRI